MTTPRNRAIYFAKQAFALMQMRGLSAGLIRLDTEDGARWSFTHDESGFVVILKHAADHAHGGAVDAARTKAANAKPAPAAPAEEPAPVDPAAGLDMGVELITEARPVRIAGGIAESGMAEEPKPAPAVITIDATPTWRGILPALVALGVPSDMAARDALAAASGRF